MRAAFWACAACHDAPPVHHPPPPCTPPPPRNKPLAIVTCICCLFKDDVGAGGGGFAPYSRLNSTSLGCPTHVALDHSPAAQAPYTLPMSVCWPILPQATGPQARPPPPPPPHTLSARPFPPVSVAWSGMMLGLVVVCPVQLAQEHHPYCRLEPPPKTHSPHPLGSLPVSVAWSERMLGQVVVGELHTAASAAQPLAQTWLSSSCCWWCAPAL